MSTGRSQEAVNPPVHWGDDWSRMGVYRAGTIDHRTGEEQPRKPFFEKPETILSRKHYTDRDLHWSKFWWSGVGFSHDEAVAFVKGDLPSLGRGCFGPYPSADKDLAHAPWLDDMFAIDADVKEYYDSPDGEPWVRVDGRKNSVTGAPIVVKRGLDDIYREAAAWGMDRDELDEHLDSWTEGTKGDGQHIVLRQNPELRIERTMHHRCEYRVDTLVNNWRGCYPSPGYTVLKDKPVKVAHKRLVELLIHCNSTLDPVGGKRMKAATKEFDRVHKCTFVMRGESVVPRDGAVMKNWRAAVLTVVHESNISGNWNNKIYWAACRYAEVGWPLERAEQDIITAAQPTDQREERKGIDTIRSAYRGVTR